MVNNKEEMNEWKTDKQNEKVGYMKMLLGSKYLKVHYQSKVFIGH